MLNFLREIFDMCNHSWVILRTIEIYSDDLKAMDMPIATKYILRCSKCGDLKSKRL